MIARWEYWEDGIFALVLESLLLDQHNCCVSFKVQYLHGVISLPYVSGRGWNFAAAGWLCDFLGICSNVAVRRCLAHVDWRNASLTALQ
jgi:hypothetical protein